MKTKSKLETLMQRAPKLSKENTEPVFKTTEILNAERPQERDLKVTIDGLNVVDLYVKAFGIKLPKLEFVVSGDKGRPTVYKEAARILRLFNGVAGFSDHRDSAEHNRLDNFKLADSLLTRAICKLEKEPEDFHLHNPALSIFVESIDFSYVQTRYLNEDAFNKLTEIISPEEK